MRTTSRMIAALALALGATGAVAQTPPAGSEGGSGAAASPPPAAPAPAAPAPAAPAPAATAPAQTSVPAAPPAAPAATPGAPPQQGTPATVLDTSDYESLLGRSVRSAGGDELGRVIDVIIDKEGHPRAAIIDFGGFLGVGTRKIAVDWRALRFTSDGKERRLSVALTRNQVRVSPEYKTGEPIVVLGPATSAPPEGGEQATTAPSAATAAPAQPAAAPTTAPTTAPAAAPNAAPAAAPTSAPAAAPAVPNPASPPQASAPEKAPDK